MLTKICFKKAVYCIGLRLIKIIALNTINRV